MTNDICVIMSKGVVAVSVVVSIWIEQSPAQPALLKVHWQWILRYV